MEFEIITNNSLYENGICAGGYHEIHKVKFIQKIDHIIATINSVIEKNLLYGYENTILEEVSVLINDEIASEEIKQYYEDHPSSIKVNVTFDPVL